MPFPTIPHNHEIFNAIYLLSQARGTVQKEAAAAELRRIIADNKARGVDIVNGRVDEKKAPRFASKDGETDKSNLTPLHYTVWLGCLPAAEILQASGDLVIQKVGGFTALQQCQDYIDTMDKHVDKFGGKRDATRKKMMKVIGWHPNFVGQAADDFRQRLGAKWTKVAQKKITVLKLKDKKKTSSSSKKAKKAPRNDSKKSAAGKKKKTTTKKKYMLMKNK